MFRKIAIAAALAGAAATAEAQDNKIILAANAGYNTTATSNAYFLYEIPRFLFAAEETSVGREIRKGFAAKAKLPGPLSVQADAEGDDAQAKAVYGDDHFSATGGVGTKGGKTIAYGGITYARRPLKEQNNFGFGAAGSNLGRDASGYAFARLKGFFGGINFASDGSVKFVASRPSEDGFAIRWIGTRDDGFAYDQVNFSLRAEIMGGLDSLRALQDKVTSPGESPATLNLNPQRFLCRNDQRGSGLDVQLSRTKRGEGASYAGEAVGHMHGNFWLGGTYDNSNGDTYGLAYGRTEHPSLGRDRVPFSIRVDIKYNTDKNDVSVGLHAAKRWKF